MKELKTVVTIVGSGSSGIAAAMTLVEQKIPFILLEKGKDLGGAGRFGANGVFAVNSKQQKAAKVNFSYEQAFNEMTKYNHYFVNGLLLSRFLKMSGKNVEWLKSIGFPTTLEPSEQVAHLNDPMVYHKFNSYKERIANWDRLEKKIIASGNQILHNTPAVDIDYEDDHLRAIIAENKDHEKIRINCKYVIYADGGYPGNKKMMQEKYFDADQMMVLGERKATGDGISAAIKAGASSAHSPVLFGHACAPSLKINPLHRDNAVETLTNLPLFWVNKNGQRFVNEDVCYDSALWANAAHNAGGRYYVVLDQKTLDTFKDNEIDLEDAFERQFTPVGQKARTTVGPLDTIQTDFDQAVSTGEVVRANTIDELAQKIKVPADILKKTVATYNQTIEQQDDPIFLKDKKHLKFKVMTGPFYAIIEHVAVLGTMDGVNVNENCQPVRDDGTPIKGIYVVGNNVNGLYGDSYPIFEGVADGFAFCSGRITGLEIAKNN